MDDYNKRAAKWANEEAMYDDYLESQRRKNQSGGNGGGGGGDESGCVPLLFVGGIIFLLLWAAYNHTMNYFFPTRHQVENVVLALSDYSQVELEDGLAPGLKNNQVHAIGAATNLQEAIQYKNMFEQQGISDIKLLYCDCKREVPYRVVIDNANAQASNRELMQIERSGIADTIQGIIIYKVKYIRDR